MGNQDSSTACITLSCVLAACMFLVAGSCCLLGVLFNKETHNKETQSPPETPPTSALPPEKLRQYRIRFAQIQHNIMQTRRDYDKLVVTWRNIFSWLERGQITRLDAFEAFQDIENAARGYYINWNIPQDFPSDVQDLLSDAKYDYELAFSCLSRAAKAAKDYVNTGSLESASEARKAAVQASAMIFSAEAKIMQAKISLGFPPPKAKKRFKVGSRFIMNSQKLEIAF